MCGFAQIPPRLSAVRTAHSVTEQVQTQTKKREKPWYISLISHTWLPSIAFPFDGCGTVVLYDGYQ